MLRPLPLPTLLSFSITAFCAVPASAAEPAGKPLGGMQLVDGFQHERLQGIDSTVGRLVRKDGFTIGYEKGRIPDPNAQFRLGGDFSNAVQRIPEKRRAWFREQTVNGVPVHLVLTTDDLLIVTYPKSGINFTAKIENPTDLADALTVLMTFPSPPAEK